MGRPVRAGTAMFVATLVLASCGTVGERAGEKEAPRAAKTTSTTALTTEPGEATHTAKLTFPAAFIPETRREGDKVVLPVAFPDGTTAELVYPPELDLAQLGARPYSWGRLKTKERTVGRDFLIVRGSVAEVWEGYPIDTYTGSGGRPVRFYATEWSPGERIDYLAFQFGAWTVSVYDYGPTGENGGARMSEEERAAWAAKLRGHETADGFLLLGAVRPLRLARAGEYPSPMSIGFGDPDQGFSLAPGKCKPREPTRTEPEKRRGFGYWCDPEASMRFWVNGDNAFVAALVSSLTVRDVKLATSVL